MNTFRMAPESQIEMGFSLAKFHQEALSISTSLALLNYFVGEQKKLFFAIVLSLMMFLKHLLQNIKTKLTANGSKKARIRLIVSESHMHSDSTTPVTDM